MEMTNALGALSALAQETRLSLFRQLVVAGAEGLPAGELARRLGIAAPTLSFHVSQMQAAGLLRSRREGRSILYAVDFAQMRALLAFLMEDCCQGHPEICAPFSLEGCAPAAPGCSPSPRTRSKGTVR